MHNLRRKPDENVYILPKNHQGTEIIATDHHMPMCADHISPVDSVVQDLSPLEPQSDETLPPNEPNEERDRARHNVVDVVESNIDIPIRGRYHGRSGGLLRKFYALYPISTLPRSLEYQGSVLVEHYFKEVCKLYSSFDSQLNPFRVSVADKWSRSGSIYYAIQSMAAAHLSNTQFPMEHIGVEMKLKADMALQEELQQIQMGHKDIDNTLLALLLLGLSACWHSVGDLGLRYLHTARRLIRLRLASETNRDVARESQDEFFYQALVYWEMMTAFMVPPQDGLHPSVDRTTEFDDTAGWNPPRNQPGPQEQHVLPHPWTGIGSEAQILLAEVGRLLRMQRSAAKMSISGIGDDIMAYVKLECTALQLEEKLLSLKHPEVASLIDPGDEQTNKADFISIAEATRYAALLELYHAFPAILRKRLSFDINHGNKASAASPEVVAHHEAKFLNSLAVHTLTLVKKLDHNSGTRFLQLLIIVAAATKLRFDQCPINLDFLDLEAGSPDGITSARDFTRRRLHFHLVRLPAKPVKRVIDLITEVWRLLDEGEDVSWLDVMVSRGWETIIG
ncbi:hypothetical protein AB5N19_01980 [Seiridium cardinale]